MNLTIGILLGIIAMIGWGTADFFVAKAVRKTNVFKTFIWSQIVGVILFLSIFFLFFKFPPISSTTIMIILFTGFLGVISYLAFYKGLQVGKVSIISPIASCWAAVTVILSIIFLGEQLTGFQALGVSLAILGTVLASFKFHDLSKMKLRNLAAGVKYAIVAMLSWGVYFLFISFLVDELGWFLPILFIKVVAVFYLLAYSSRKRMDISFPKNVALFVLLIGILEATAFLCFGIAVVSEYTLIVAPIGAAFPAVTIILARIFFKEILEINQKIGIISVLAGLVLLSL